MHYKILLYFILYYFYFYKYYTYTVLLLYTHILLSKRVPKISVCYTYYKLRILGSLELLWFIWNRLLLLPVGNHAEQDMTV